MKSNNHATPNWRTSQTQDVESGTTPKTLWISVLTVIATQSLAPTEVELIPSAIVTVIPHVKRKTMLVLKIPTEMLRTEFPNKLRKPSLISFQKSSTDASPAASRNALTGKNDHILHLNKTLATSELLTFHNTFNPKKKLIIFTSGV